MKINLKLLLTLLILAVGLYLLLAYKDNPQLTPKERKALRTKRYIGVGMIISSVILGVYFYYTGAIKFSAKMPNDCDICKNYVKRHRELRPFHADEYNQLRRHATACNVCSNMCFDYIQLMEKYPPTEPEKQADYRKELSQRKSDCAETTKHAILAKKELDRLGAKIRGNQARLWAAANAVGGRPTWDPFPQVPK